MTVLAAGSSFPAQSVAAHGGGRLTLGVPGEGYDWQMVVVYRGLHCPLCKKYLAQLNDLLSGFNALGVDVVAVSGDPQDKAETMVAELNLLFGMGYDLKLEQMQALGLFISDPRSPQETDRPFPEPGLFVINEAKALQIIDISNAPFARPDLQIILNGIRFIRENNYPVRGTHHLRE